MATTIWIMASFTAPEQIGTTPQSLLWLLPLAAAIAVVYKATKVPQIRAGSFLKESLALFCSIVVFMAITAVILHVLTWFATR